jgi:hypothetical protein
MSNGAVDLPERCGGSRVMLETRELALPVRPELGAHAALHEGPAHGRRLVLQLRQLFNIFRRQCVRDGGHQLRHLHDRALQPAKRCGKLHGIAPAVERHAEKARPGHAGSDPANVGAHARVARCAGGEPVSFAVGSGIGHRIPARVTILARTARSMCWP